MSATIHFIFDDDSGLTYFDIPDDIIDEITLHVLSDYDFSLKV